MFSSYFELACFIIPVCFFKKVREKGECKRHSEFLFIFCPALKNKLQKFTAGGGMRAETREQEDCRGSGNVMIVGSDSQCS